MVYELSSEISMLQESGVNIVGALPLEKSDSIDNVDKIETRHDQLIESGFELKNICPDDEDLWLKMGQLRAKIYVNEHDFLSPDVLDKNGAEYDEYDNTADHFVAISDQGNVIGTIRMINREEGKKLPSEKLFDTVFSNGTREISRIMVDSSVLHRQRSLVTISLIRAVLKDAVKGENDDIFAVIEPSLHRYLNDILGIKLKTETEPKFIEEYNSVNSVISMHPFTITSEIHGRDKSKRSLKGLPEKLAPFFEQNASISGLGRVALNTINCSSPEQFDRNLGFISKSEHEHLQNSTVAIAGAGGDGGELAIALVQLGVGKFKIADPEVFEVNNLNRQAGASFNTIGQNKATVIAEMIKDINPYAEVEVFTDGVTSENVDKFVQGSNLVIDETEFTHHEIGVMIARIARENKLPVLMTMNVGFGAYTTSFAPNGKTLESYLGLDEKASLEEIAKKEVSLCKWAPHIPSYSDMTAFEKVANQEVKTPSVAPGVKMAVAEASTQALAHLLKDITPERSKWIYYAPRGKSIDVIDGVNMINFPKMHFLSSVAIASLRTFFHKNPRAGY